MAQFDYSNLEPDTIAKLSDAMSPGRSRTIFSDQEITTYCGALLDWIIRQSQETPTVLELVKDLAGANVTTLLGEFVYISVPPPPGLEAVKDLLGASVMALNGETVFIEV